MYGEREKRERRSGKRLAYREEADDVEEKAGRGE